MVHENSRATNCLVFTCVLLGCFPQAFFYGAGSSVSMLGYLTSQRRSLPPPDSHQEKIDFGPYERSKPDGHYLQEIPYVYRGPHDRGDASVRPGNGRSPDILQTRPEPQTQVEESRKPEPGVRLSWCSLS